MVPFVLDFNNDIDCVMLKKNNESVKCLSVPAKMYLGKN